jgi:DNA-binding NtrC family response regulator
MLSDEQHMVQTCQSVADALKAIEKRPFDAYVMDYKLPDGTGVEVAEQVRSKWGATPIILMSGYHPSAVELRAADLQIYDFIEKPFSREIICNAVKKAIGLAAAPASASESHQAEGSRQIDLVPQRLAAFKQMWRTLNSVFS